MSNVPYNPADIGASFGDDTRTAGASKVLPESLYPVSINVVKAEPSKNAGTPGVYLELTVTEGPAKGMTIRERDSVLWLTPGRPFKANGEPSTYNGWGLVNHMTAAITGNSPRYTALPEAGFEFSGGDRDDTNFELKQQFAELDPEARMKFVSQYCRLDEWDGRTAIVSIGVETETVNDPATGQPKLDSEGNPVTFDRNRVVNFFGLKDEKRGLAYVRKSCFPHQEAELS